MQADFLLDYDVVTVEQEQKLYLMARLVAGVAPDQGNRRPLNLSVVIDRSGSMAGNKINYTRQAAQLLVQNMSSEDILSIVLYNETVETLLPPQQVKHKDLISQRLGEIKAGGTTNLSSGWLEGVNHVNGQLTTETVNRVILMSDGHANRGITDPERLVLLARQKWDSGISTTTMGLGEDFNEDLLMAIADAGGGAFYFIESPEVAPAIFQEELKGLLSVVGQNLTITITPTEHVTQIHQLNAYPTEATGHSTAFRLGDIFGEEVKSLMLELTIPALKEIGQIKIAHLRFEFDEVKGDTFERQSLERDVWVNVAAGILDDGIENKEVTRSMLLLRAAEARREAIRLADKGRYDEAAKTLRETAEAIHKANLNDPVLEEERGALISQSKDMDRGADFYQSYSRKSMSTQAYFTSRGVHESTQALRLREEKRKSEQPNANNPSGAGDTDLVENNDEIARITGFFDSPIPIGGDAIIDNDAASNRPPVQMRWRDKTFPLNGSLLRIGRAPQNEIVINASGVSRFHAQIRRDGENWILEDLGSTNGTHVAGRMLDKPYTLRAGDVIFVCDQRVDFDG